jgi:hypothetical protein
VTTVDLFDKETSMSAPAVSSSTSVYAGGAFWERMWRSAGIQSAACFILASILVGHQPGMGASADALTAFYLGERTRILIAAVLAGFAILNLLWFSSAIRTTLAGEGKDGWGSAEIGAAGALGGMFLLFVTVITALAYSVAGNADHALLSGLNDFAWATFVLMSFPRAMLIMAGSFGLWRAGLISNATFTACVGAVVAVLLGGTTWFENGAWAPDGVYSSVISPIVGLAWVIAVSAFLIRRPASRTGW